MKTHFSSAVIGAVALTIAGLSAQAQPRRIAAVAVSVDPGLEREAAAVREALQRVVRADTQCELVDLAAMAAGDARARKAAQGAELAADALKLLDRLDDQAALRKANEAVAAYEESDLTRALPGLLDSLAVRAFALLSLGNKEDVKGDLMRLFALSPDYRLDPRRVSPVLSTLASQARAAVSKAPRVTIDARSDPEAAEIFLDGVYRGTGAASVSGLPRGIQGIPELSALTYSVTVVAGYGDTPGATAPLAVIAKNVSTTGFKFQCGGAENVRVNWVAIGRPTP